MTLKNRDKASVIHQNRASAVILRFNSSSAAVSHEVFIEIEAYLSDEVRLNNARKGSVQLHRTSIHALVRGKGLSLVTIASAPVYTQLAPWDHQ